MRPLKGSPLCSGLLWVLCSSWRSNRFLNSEPTRFVLKLKELEPTNLFQGLHGPCTGEIMETLFYEKLDKARVQCGICHHRCIIVPGKRGLCKVRENIQGKLESLVYAKVVARAIDPVEKKPIVHLKPGSLSYSIATVGCNFRCTFCQNSDIAQMPADQGGLIRGVTMAPEIIVEQAIRGRCQSISYTYTEPTVYLEFALDKLNPRGLIIADNTLWSGKVLRRPQSGDSETQGIIKFNKMVKENPGLDSFLLPFRDGITFLFCAMHDPLFRFSFLGVEIGSVLALRA